MQKNNNLKNTKCKKCQPKGAQFLHLGCRDTPLCPPVSYITVWANVLSNSLRAFEHRKCAAGLAGAHPSLQGRILLNYTRIEHADKVRK